jgi:hypothetical protein
MYLVCLPGSPTTTNPGIGPELSMMTPLDVALLHKPAPLQLITTEKYFTPWWKDEFHVLTAKFPKTKLYEIIVGYEKKGQTVMVNKSININVDNRCIFLENIKTKSTNFRNWTKNEAVSSLLQINCIFCNNLHILCLYCNIMYANFDEFTNRKTTKYCCGIS